MFPKKLILRLFSFILLFQIINYSIITPKGPDGFNLKAAEFLEFQRPTIAGGIDIIAEVFPISVGKKERVIISLFGRIEEGKHIYSLQKQGDFAPEPSRIVINSAWLKVSDKPVESPPEMITDEAFGVQLYAHKREFKFTQEYLVSSEVQSGKYEFTGYLEYQICDNKICSLLKSKSFKFSLVIK